MELVLGGYCAAITFQRLAQGTPESINRLVGGLLSDPMDHEDGGVGIGPTHRRECAQGQLEPRITCILGKRDPGMMRTRRGRTASLQG